MKRHILFIAFAISVISSFSQNVDSLWTERNNTDNHDTIKYSANYKLILHYQKTNIDSAIILSNWQIELAKKLDDKSRLGWAYFDLGYSQLAANQNKESIETYHKSYDIFKELKKTATLTDITNNIAYAHLNIGEYEDAFKYYLESKKYAEERKDTNMLGRIYNQLAMTRDYEGRWIEALDLYFKSLEKFESINNKNGIGTSYTNIATIYNQLNDPVKAKDYFDKSLKIKQELNDEYGITIVLSNLANIHIDEKEFDKAFEKFNEALEIYKKYNAKSKIAVTYCGIAGVYASIGNDTDDKTNYSKAIENYLKGIEVFREIDDKAKLSQALSSLGENYIGLNNFVKGKDACEEGFKISQEVGYPKSEKANCRCLSKVYEKLGDKGKALKYYKQFIEIRDSLVNEDRNLEASRKDLSFSFAKEQLKDSLENAKAQEIKDIKISEQETQLENERMQKYGLSLGAVLLLILGGVSYRSYRVKKKDNVVIAAQKQEVEEQKEEIENQKVILEVKNKEITDSITYAKRIQEAILPPTKLVKQWLPNSFVLYKPKDIVAGDFYWMETDKDNIFFAAADCTGHGVPGAMVSVVCHNAMNRAIKEFGLSEPGKILDKTRDLVVEQFEKSEEDVKDGMDVALCVLNTKNNTIKYAGANNPLWIIEKGAEEVMEIKANKQPIGKVDNPVNFDTHNVELKDGMNIYIFSDGFADQFGGEKGKKFKYRPFKELLLSIHDKSVEDQRSSIDKEFEAWKGDLEQVDDVCIIGVKV